MFLSLSLCSKPVERNAFLKTPDTPIKTNSLVLQQSVSVSDNPLCREIVWYVWLFLFHKIRIIFFSAYTGQITPTNHQELSEKPYYISEIYSHCHLWFIPLFDKNRTYIHFFHLIGLKLRKTSSLNIAPLLICFTKYILHITPAWVCWLWWCLLLLSKLAELTILFPCYSKQGNRIWQRGDFVTWDQFWWKQTPFYWETREVIIEIPLKKKCWNVMIILQYHSSFKRVNCV